MKMLIFNGADVLYVSVGDLLSALEQGIITQQEYADMVVYIRRSSMPRI